MIVSNSSPLIYLSKIDKHYLLKDLFGKVFIPLAVKEEVVDWGKKKDYIDAFETEKAIDEGWIKVEKVKTIPELSQMGIHKGEAEAISLANTKKLNLLLDEDYARLAAKLFKVDHNGTLFVLLAALKKKLIDLDIYLLSLEDLVEVGFRMSQDVYLRAVRTGKEIVKK